MLRTFRWGSSESPWHDLDDDGVEVPRDQGDRVSIRLQFQFCGGSASLMHSTLCIKSNDGDNYNYTDSEEEEG